VLTAVYVAWSLLTWEHKIEWAGSLALLGSGILAAFIAYYLRLHYKKQGGALPEDRLHADIDDGDPELGEFSPWSWWPIALAGSIALTGLGLAIGFFYWLSFFAAPLILVSVVGLVMEYYRGNFAR
jgi:hypothetical protein